MSRSAPTPVPANPPDGRRLRLGRRHVRRGLAAGAALGLVGAAFATDAGPRPATASSHREAPIIAGDPRADNTDVYAFVSPESPDMVTIISNWIPFEEPNGGPNFYDWADSTNSGSNTTYNIKVDSNGDAVPDLTYSWVFTTHRRNASDQFLYNTGVISSLDDPDLNVYQTYTLKVTNAANVTTTLLTDKQAAPSIVGPASTPDYSVLRQQATYTLPGGGQTYAGQADDPFFLDLRVFDLLYGGNLSEAGQDTLAGYNVNTIALQLPKSALALNGDATRNPAIGIWSTTDRNGTQVSRLGNPLVNEAVIPLSLKDAFNSVRPDQDAGIQPVVDKVNDPTLPKVVQAVYGIPAPAAPRTDLFEVFLTGIAADNGANGPVKADLNSQLVNKDAVRANFRPSEMLRLNMNVPPAASPARLGVLGGDFAGFPNGRRLTDDVIDIGVQALEGAVVNGIVAPLAKGDNVDRNDHAFGTAFPYVALPNVAAVNTGPTQAPRAPELVSSNPQRVLETRTDQGGQIGYTGAKPAAGAVVAVKVAGVAGVPTGTKSVLLNVTAVNTAGTGFVTVYACDTARPTASSFNPRAGAATQNLVVAPVAADGTVCIYTSQSTDLVADLAGFHPAGSSYIGTAPERLLETRTTEGGQIGHTGPMPADGQVVTLKVTGVGTAKVPADAKAVFLNLTAVNSAGPGFVTAYPCGTTPPLASNVNTASGQAQANLVAAKVSASGTVCLFVSRSTDLVVDLQGYEPGTSNYQPLVPERVLESRSAEGQVGYSGSTPIGGQTVEVKVTGTAASKIPASAASVLLNVTAVGATGPGFVTVFPCGSPRPLASNLNIAAGETATNLVSAKVGDGGRVCIYTSTATNLVADVNGYYPDATIGVTG